jgi:predicted dienelactone hydrolase
MKHILVFVIFIMSNMAMRAQGFSVGHAQASYIDATRANRNVTCELYYPADVSGDNVAIAAGVFPVLVIGHGFVMSATVYDIYWNALVPEGYVVAVPTTEGSLFPSHDNFGKDMAFLVSQLQSEGNNATSFLYNAIATTSAVMGHSMDGGSAFLAMQANPNITAMAAMAPAETNPSAVSAAANIQRPTLIFAGINDCVAPPADHQLPMFNALASNCKSYVGIVGGDHCQFASSNFNCTFGQSTCSPQATISASEQQSSVLDNLIPWLDFYLKNDCAQGEVFQSNVSNNAAFELQQNCTLGCGTSIFDAISLNFSLYPNPCAEWLRWKGDAKWVGQTFSILDMQGRTIEQGKLNVNGDIANIGAWSNGVYFLKVGPALVVPFTKN